MFSCKLSVFLSLVTKQYYLKKEIQYKLFENIICLQTVYNK